MVDIKHCAICGQLLSIDEVEHNNILNKFYLCDFHMHFFTVFAELVRTKKI